MTDTVTLVCPPGAEDYAISYGEHKYQSFLKDPLDPASPWHVTMPRHAALDKLRVGGFALAKMQIGPLSSGESVRLVDKHGVHRSVGVNGVEYKPDPDGVITVPMEYVAELVDSHEFVPAPPIEEKEDPVAELHEAAAAVAAKTAPSTELQEIRAAVTEARADLADFDEKNPGAKKRADAKADKAEKDAAKA